MQSSDQIQPFLRIDAISKRYPGVLALSEASFDLFPGEIHALVGENGAGKSTLIKILTGATLPDSGSIALGKSEMHFKSPQDAQRAGIATIYQEYTLIPTLSVQDNLFLGRETQKGGLIDGKQERAAGNEVFLRLGVEIDLDTIVRDLTVAQQQLVEIGRALITDARILVMDEPTAALTPKEVNNLFTILRELASQGIAIIFVSHRLDEVLSIADRITVLRDGSTVDTRKARDYSRNSLIEQMVGKTLEQEYPSRQAATGETGLIVRSLSGEKVQEISFTVRHGEVLGFAGLLGAGLTEIARLIFGADRKRSGDILLDGRPISIDSPRDAIDNRICLLTEDRKGQGLSLHASVLENFSLPNLPRWSTFGWIDQTEEQNRFQSRVTELNIRLTDASQPSESLSGGNQQKLLIARWLETDSEVIIFDEPTRGVDVGAKYEIYALINRLAGQGKMILIMSSEIPELLGMCDRIFVLRRGRIAGEIVDVTNARQDDIMALAV